MLDVVGMPNQEHAIMIDQYSSLLLQVEGNISLVRWFPIDE